MRRQTFFFACFASFSASVNSFVAEYSSVFARPSRQSMTATSSPFTNILSESSTQFSINECWILEQRISN